ncbi:hypothetical protein AB7M70_011858 [Bradyrhizobium japonicum]
MISTLLREVEKAGCSVIPENGQLKLENAGVLASVLKEQLRERKVKILERFEQQGQARKLGWIVYPYGEAYEKRIGRNSSVYLFEEENGSWTVWRGTWKDKRSAETEKLVIENVNFEKAFDKANSYASWFLK